MTAVVRATVGKPAPPLDLEASDGRRVRLAELRGAAVLVVFLRHLA